MSVDSSLSWVALTVAAFAVAAQVHQRSGKMPLLQPVLLAIAAIGGLLLVAGLPYQQYFDGTRWLHGLLGPAIVALALPLHENLRTARQVTTPLFITVLLGGAAVIGSALLLGWLAGLDKPMQLSLATKSISAPIALSVAAKIGGVAPLTILSVFVTGILGVMVTPSLLRWLGVDSPLVKGFTLGMTSHAFGIARSAEWGGEAVAFATLGMALMGCTTAVLVPLLFRLFL